VKNVSKAKFIEGFMNSTIVKAACRDLPFDHPYNKMSLTERMVYLRNKAIEKRLDLSAE
jgi:hypothetical protein